MSHFAVLVITKENPHNGLLEKVMAPYHEYACTEEDNAYVQDIDITAEARKEYDEYTYTCFVDPQGIALGTAAHECALDRTAFVGRLGHCAFAGGQVDATAGQSTGAEKAAAVHFHPVRCSQPS